MTEGSPEQLPPEDQPGKETIRSLDKTAGRNRSSLDRWIGRARAQEPSHDQREEGAPIEVHYPPEPSARRFPRAGRAVVVLTSLSLLAGGLSVLPRESDASYTLAPSSSGEGIKNPDFVETSEIAALHNDVIAAIEKNVQVPGSRTYEIETTDPSTNQPALIVQNTVDTDSALGGDHGSYSSSVDAPLNPDGSPDYQRAIETQLMAANFTDEFNSERVNGVRFIHYDPLSDMEIYIYDKNPEGMDRVTSYTTDNYISELDAPRIVPADGEAFKKPYISERRKLTKDVWPRLKDSITKFLGHATNQQPVADYPIRVE